MIIPCHIYTSSEVRCVLQLTMTAICALHVHLHSQSFPIRKQERDEPKIISVALLRKKMKKFNCVVKYVGVKRKKSRHGTQLSSRIFLN